MRVLDALIFNAHSVARLNLKRRNVNFPAVHLDVAMINKLPSLTARSRETRTVDDIIQPTLEHKQQILAGNAFLAQRLVEIIAELLFEDKVNPFYLLFFPELLTVAGEHFSPRRAVLTRRVSTAFFDRT